MPTEPVLRMSRVTRTYRAGVRGCNASVTVLRALSLDVAAGEFVPIDGGSGAGKTTLLLCAAGMLRTDAGVVQWPLLQAAKGRPRDAVRYVGERAPTYGFLTVRESLAYATALREIAAPNATSCTVDSIAMTDLTSLTGTRVALLSRGERARFLVALALISNPRLLLVDDLTTGESEPSVDRFRACLEAVAAAGIGVVWTACWTGAAAGYELAGGALLRKLPKTAWLRSAPEPLASVYTADPHPVVHRVAEPQAELPSRS